jgi:hypothetical protein
VKGNDVNPLTHPQQRLPDQLVAPLCVHLYLHCGNKAIKLWVGEAALVIAAITGFRIL